MAWVILFALMTLLPAFVTGLLFSIPFINALGFWVTLRLFITPIRVHNNYYSQERRK